MIGQPFMRKINKNTCLSTEYEEWLKELEAKGEDHLKYSSSKHTYYNDVKFALLHCQRGLCAYTEIELCEEDILTSDNWINGRYDFDKEAKQAAGQVEHFDESLKEKKGWLWSNLFVADSRVNVLKGRQKVDDILKPDSDDYDPKDRLEFDSELNVYIPSANKTPEEQARIKRMIKVLGLNYGHITRKRKSFIKTLKERIDNGTFKLEAYEGEAFPTALAFILSEKNAD